MKVTIVKSVAGNIQSIVFALKRLGITPAISDHPDAISSADKVILPGVGEASTTMQFLKKNKLDQVITKLEQPVLGICLGMQVMCRYSEENRTTCLGIFDFDVKQFDSKQSFKIPHTGWNTIQNVKGWLSADLENSYMYYVHSYYVPVNDLTIAITDYGIPISAALHKDNFYGVQFHPEKSAAHGQIVIKNFIEI